jgi:hypothetical protein
MEFLLDFVENFGLVVLLQALSYVVFILINPPQFIHSTYIEAKRLSIYEHKIYSFYMRKNKVRD